VPRLFIAIDFPPEIKLALSRLCDGLPGVRWVAPDKFHLTLCFIGEADDATTAAIAAALQRVEASRFRLTLAGVGQFSGHTLWVGVEDNPALAHLQHDIETRLQKIVPPTDARPYRPHVKLAHSRRRRSFRSFLDEHAGFGAGPFEVTEFSLIESHLSESGPIYEHRADFGLLASDKPAAIAATAGDEVKNPASPGGPG
jgi:RNA 2',3'-cyclic 3'-phosphodiesterase